jgi:FkbM family methyltransferase
MTGRDIRDSWTAGRSLVLYGAGNAGRTVARHLRTHGIAVAAFLDAGATPGDMRDGVPVYTLADWLKMGRVDQADVIVSIHNPFVDAGAVIDTLRASGFARVLSMIDYINLFPDDPEERDCLLPSAYYDDKEDRINAVRALLSDELSLVWFDAVLRFRRAGDYSALPAPRLNEQYMPADLPRWAEPMRLIDCGAYDGDTIDAMLGNGYNIESVAAFEPEPENYRKLVARFAGLDAVLLPCGVSSGAGLVRFKGGLGTSSRIVDTGETTIQCVGIDEALPSFAPTLIKMDIEGAELAALRGAERSLRSHRPGLAIAIYHKPEDLWEIPLWLAERKLGYRMYVRGHCHVGYEFILYCHAP